MGLDVRFKREIRAALVGGIVVMVRGAQFQGWDARFIAGALAMAEHRALVEGMDWPAMLGDAREVLGEAASRMIDESLMLQAENPRGR